MEQFKKNIGKKNISNKFLIGYYEFNLIIFFSFLGLILKILFSNNLKLILMSSIFEFLSIFLFLLIIRFLQIKISENKIKHKISLIFLKIIFYIVLFFDTILILVNSYFIDESYLIRYSFFNFDVSIILYFFDELFPYRLFILLGCVLIVIFILAYFIKGSKRLFRKNQIFEKRLIYICIFVWILLVLFSSSFSNVYLNSFSQFINDFNNEKISLNDSNNFKDDLDYTDDSNDLNSSNSSHNLNENQTYAHNNFKWLDLSLNESNIKDMNHHVGSEQKVLIFVMESVPEDVFLSEMKKIPQNESFMTPIKENLHFYTNYYTTNQDSSTSVLSLLNSVFIPYDAYDLNWYESYGKKIDKTYDLVDLFNDMNFSTKFVVSARDKPGFHNVVNWSEVITIDENEFEGEIAADSNQNRDEREDKEKYLCLQVFENQKGCEDRVILNKLVGAVSNSSDLFLMQELIYGHSVKYELEKGMTIVNYYNYYFLELFNELEKEGLMDNLTIFIVSDHGVRNMKDKAHTSTYKIPLIVYSKNIDKYQEIPDLKNHLDFKDILLSYISFEIDRNLSQEEEKKQEESKKNIINIENNEGKVNFERKELFFIGQTRTQLFGYLNNNGSGFTVREDLRGEDYTILEKNGEFDDIQKIKEKLIYFNEYRNDFDSE